MLIHWEWDYLKKKKISWLDENGWKACGYEVEKVENSYTLTRNPLRRFEDIDSEKENTVVNFSLKKMIKF